MNGFYSQEEPNKNEKTTIMNESVHVAQFQENNCSKASENGEDKASLLNGVETKGSPEKFDEMLITRSRNLKNSLTPKQFQSSSNGKEVLRCSKCEFTTPTEALLKRHLMTHVEEKRFKCAKCNYSTNLNSRLKEHEMIHWDLRPYKCSICGFCSKLKANLKRHQKIHNKSKQDGSRSSTEFENLDDPKVKVTKKNVYSSEKCSNCDLVFSTKSALIRHKKKGHSIPPNKRFSSKLSSTFKQTSQKGPPYTCLICGIKYKLERSLRIHEATHINCEEKDSERIPFLLEYLKCDFKTPQELNEGKMPTEKNPPNSPVEMSFSRRSLHELELTHHQKETSIPNSDIEQSQVSLICSKTDCNTEMQEQNFSERELNLECNFKSNDDFATHKTTHGKSPANKSNQHERVLNHESIHSGVSSYSSYESLSNSESPTLRKILLTCLKCGYLACNSSRLREHERKHLNTKHQFKQIEDKFKDKVYQNDISDNRVDEFSQTNSLKDINVDIIKVNSEDELRIPQEEHQPLQCFERSLSNEMNCNTKKFQKVQLFKCSQCSYETNKKRQLTKHRFIHSKNKFACGYCRFTTMTKRLLKKHEEIHK